MEVQSLKATLQLCTLAKHNEAIKYEFQRNNINIENIGGKTNALARHIQYE